MDDFVDTRLLADALGWEKRGIDDLVDSSRVSGRREGPRTLISLRGFLEYVWARHNYGQQARANVRAREAPVGPDRPLVITGFAGGPVVLTDGPSRTRGASSAGNMLEWTDAHGVRRSRRDFRADFITGE